MSLWRAHRLGRIGPALECLAWTGPEGVEAKLQYAQDAFTPEAVGELAEGLFSLLTVIAIAFSLVVNSQALKAAVISWKKAAEAHGPVLRNGLDETSLKVQNRLVKPFLTKKLGK